MSIGDEPTTDTGRGISGYAEQRYAEQRGEVRLKVLDHGSHRRPRQGAKVTRAEKVLRKALWESGEGCTCKVVVDGKFVPAEDRCSPKVIRCNGRANAWRKALSDNGLKVPK